VSFHGSYRAEDVEFLLTPIQLTQLHDVADKEQLIQSGARHYSEMLTPEQLPSAQYMQLFDDALQRNGQRMANDCLQLCTDLAASVRGEIVIVSLARAGTPVGAILKHLLQRRLQRDCSHYSVSIIRDRGIDAVALDHVRARHADASIVFVDGWTGKGVISRELRVAIADYNQTRGAALADGLYVLADLCGVAHHAASYEDYLIPSAILNSTVSGLVSRSILNDQIGPEQFHGCVYFDQFRSNDLSVAFVERIVDLAMQAPMPAPLLSGQAVDKQRCAAVSVNYMQQVCSQYGIANLNLVKPGIAEATRVLLRRLPDRLILRDESLADVAHLKRLALEKGVAVQCDPDLPYNAVSLIRSVANGH